jgi:FkbM family methyltransferase
MPPGWPEVGRQLLDSSIAFAPWAVHAALVRRSCIREGLFWEESLDRLVAEDIVYWFRLVHTCKVIYSDTLGPLTRMGVPGSRTLEPKDGRWLESMIRISQMNLAWLSNRGQQVTAEQQRSLAVLFAQAALAGGADPVMSKRARQLATAHFDAWWKLQPRPRRVGDMARRFLGPFRMLQYRSAQKQWVRHARQVRGWVGTVLTKSRHLGGGVPRLVAGTKMQIDESLRRWNFDCEAEVFEELRRYLRPGSVFVDIGANFGMHTLVAASLVGPAGKVLSFEPLPRNAALLRRHIRLNRFREIVQVFEEAVSDSPEPFTFFSTDDADPLGLTASIAPGEAAGKLRVANVRLDDVLPRLASQVDVIKIDVEGAEHAVLRGAVEILRRQRPVLIIEVHGYVLPDFSSSVRLLEQCLLSLGYSGRRLNISSSLMDSYFHSVYTPSQEVLQEPSRQAHRP